MANIPQPFSADIRLPIDAAGQGARDASTIARGIGALAEGADRAYAPILQKQQQQEQLVEKTNLLKLQRNVEDAAIRGYEEISSRPDFAQLSTDDAIAELDTNVEKLVDAELDRLGKEGPERDYLREQALNTKRVATARYGLGEANSKAKIDDVNNTLISETNIISNRTYDNPDELAASLEELRDTYAVYGDVLGEKRINDAIRKAHPALIDDAVKGYINQGRFGDARALLNDKGAIKVTSALNADQRDKMLGDVDRAEAAVLRAQEKAAEEAAKINAATARVAGAWNGSVILDDRNKEDRDAVNTVFDQMTPALADMSSEDRIDTVADFVGTTKVVPDVIKSAIRVSKLAPAQQQAETAALVGKIDQLAPGLLESTTGLTDVDMARSTMINDMIAAGQPVNEAVSRTSQLVDPNNSAMVKARTEAFKDIEPITAANVAGSFENFAEGWVPFVDDVEIPDRRAAALEKQVNDIFKRQYQLTGDEDIARDYALKQIKKVWGRTEVDGRLRLMEYPPEAFYAFNDDNSWMTEQLISDTAELLGKDRSEVEGRVILEGDEITARQAGRQAPSYVALFKNDNGEFVTLSQRWAPDATTAAEAWRKENIQSAEKVRSDAIKTDSRIRELISQAPYFDGVDVTSPNPEGSILSDIQRPGTKRDRRGQGQK